jgi:hypothetical protein
MFPPHLEPEQTHRKIIIKLKKPEPESDKPPYISPYYDEKTIFQKHRSISQTHRRQSLLAF